MPTYTLHLDNEDAVNWAYQHKLIPFDWQSALKYAELGRLINSESIELEFDYYYESPDRTVGEIAEHWDFFDFETDSRDLFNPHIPEWLEQELITCIKQEESCT